MSIYVKNFETNSIQIKDSIRVSSFFPEGLKEIIEEFVPERNYVLGVTYTGGDSQICISGHSKENETFLEGVCRELEEELCLKTKNILEPVGNKGMNTFFCLNVRDAYLKKNKKVNPFKDDPKRGVVCVFGREKDILLYLAKVKYNPNNDDGINCIWSTSKENILNYCRIGKGDILNCENYYYSSFY